MKVLERGKDNMAIEKEHTNVGIASIILGILGLIIYFIGWFFYSFVDNRLYGIIIGIIFGILAVTLGYLAKKQGDNYGTYGILLGALIIIIAFITFLLTTITYVETSYST
jgi:hypothetical protein